MLNDTSLTENKKEEQEKRPDVTVYIAAYNAEATIERTIKYAKDQPGLDVEILVRDDGSTDGTVDVLKSLDVKYFVNRKNQGVPVTLNRLLSEATGRYLFNTDADDYVEVGALSTLVAHADIIRKATENRKLFLYGNTMYHTVRGAQRLHRQTPELDKRGMYKRNLVCSDILVPIESYTLDGIKYIEDRLIHEDWAYMLSLLEHGYHGYGVDSLVLHYFESTSGNYATIQSVAEKNMKKYFKMRR